MNDFQIRKVLLSAYFGFIMVTVGFAGLLVFESVMDEGSVEGATTRYVGGSISENYSKIQDSMVKLKRMA